MRQRLRTARIGERDISRRQAAGRDLVQQRLEEMEVAPVDHRHLNGRPLERVRGVQPAETAADDHRSMGGMHGLIRSEHSRRGPPIFANADVVSIALWR